MNFLRAIGQYIEGSGIREVWTESLVFGENTAENILQAKHYNRCLRAHKLTFEAPWRVLWVQVEAWAQKMGMTYTSSVKKLTIYRKHAKIMCMNLL